MADAALAMIDRDGLDALSMRRLASELDVTPMALYNHVPNKEALLDAVLERMLGMIELPDVAEHGWQEALRGGIRSFRRVLLEHPNALPLVFTHRIASPEAFKPIEFSVGIFRAAGMDPEKALHSHWTVIGFVLGHVSFQISMERTGRTGEFETAVREGKVAPERFPNLLQCLPYLIDCDFEAPFEYGFETLLAGLASQLQD